MKEPISRIKTNYTNCASISRKAAMERAGSGDFQNRPLPMENHPVGLKSLNE